jgi:hypothetical protein
VDLDAKYRTLVSSFPSRRRNPFPFGAFSLLWLLGVPIPVIAAATSGVLKYQAPSWFGGA